MLGCARDVEPRHDAPAIPIDREADLALAERARAVTTAGCDLCGAEIVGEAYGSGLFLWTRGDERRVEEPPLCEDCATVLGVAAHAAWEIEEEEG